jgi:hypothetical protein
MNLFGTQIHYVRSVFDAKRAPLDAGPTAKARLALAQQYTKVMMVVIVSLSFMVTSCILLLGDYSPELHKIAAGLAGTVLGYWAR